MEMLLTEFPNLDMSLSTVKRAKLVGWVSTKPRYCQLIHEANRLKRLTWCEERTAAGDTFDDVIWFDKSSVVLDSHRKICYRNKGQPPKNKPRPKHPAKIHVWGGISEQGATPVVLFSGILIATCYVEILEAGLVPFLNSRFPEGHRFQQDNGPKHTSRYAQNYYEEASINWWKTPAESPDLHPIENVWGSMKTFRIKILSL